MNRQRSCPPVGEKEVAVEEEQEPESTELHLEGSENDHGDVPHDIDNYYQQSQSDPPGINHYLNTPTPSPQPFERRGPVKPETEMEEP